MILCSSCFTPISLITTAQCSCTFTTGIVLLHTHFLCKFPRPWPLFTDSSRSSPCYLTSIILHWITIWLPATSSSLHVITIIFLYFFKIIYLLIFERQTERPGEGQRERERENVKQAPHCQHRARCGAQTHKP